MTKNGMPFMVRLHNVTCPAWLSKLSFLKKIEPGCRIALGYEKKE